MPTYHLEYKRQPTRKDGRGKIEAKRHYDYISREGTSRLTRHKGEDLQHKDSGNIPSWSKEKAANFWKEADKHERKNGCAYREIIVGLPMELSLDENIECIEIMID